MGGLGRVDAPDGLGQAVVAHVLDVGRRCVVVVVAALAMRAKAVGVVHAQIQALPRME